MIILNVILITMVCRIGVSLVDPFSHVVLILQLHQQAFPPYPFWVHVLLFPGSTAMILGYQASYSETSTNFLNFFFQSDRLTQYQKTHLTLNGHHHRHHRYLHRRLTVLCRLRLLRLNCYH